MLIHEELTQQIIGCAIEGHRQLGPGLAEYSYQTSLALEMTARHISFVEQPSLVVRYQNVVVGWHRPDFIVEEKVVVEIKAVGVLNAVFAKQVLTYLRVSKLQVGLLFNFNVPSMNEAGIKRYVL
jgi:GxxExxY protein